MLNGTVGASDYFKANCASNANGDTDHLNFKVIDSTATAGPSAYYQVINVDIYKDKVFQQTLNVVAGETKALDLPLGNGNYKLSLNTNGTDQTKNAKNKYIIQKEMFEVHLSCLNSNGVATKKAVNLLRKSVKLNGNFNYTMSCKSNKKLLPADTEKLAISVVNTSPVVFTSPNNILPVLNTQVSSIVKGKTLNTSDIAGDDVYSPEINLAAGNADYFISVNSTSTVDNAESVKNYSFQYQCLNAAFQETATGDLVVIQDQ
jgi:hypothetical protein